MSATPSPERPRLQIANGYDVLSYKGFAYKFAQSEPLIRAVTVPIAYAPSHMHDRSSTGPDGTKLAFLGDSILRTILATVWAIKDNQDDAFWTRYFDNGMAKDSFLESIGEEIQIARHLVTPEGESIPPEMWETPSSPTIPFVEAPRESANGRNKAIVCAIKALVGAIWTDCCERGSAQDSVETVAMFLVELGIYWPQDEEQRMEVERAIIAADLATMRMDERARDELGAGQESRRTNDGRVQAERGAKQAEQREEDSRQPRDDAQNGKSHYSGKQKREETERKRTEQQQAAREEEASDEEQRRAAKKAKAVAK